ncbi:MAG: orotidine-5'-phosphate decarboxylase [Lachnospiraceae bacterium]|nr:orotidine-5'-phosphate decarboxylase [Lachnospiraceae bacterium]
MSMDKLIRAIAEKKNPTVVGLDPKLSYLPSFLKEEAFTRCGANLEGAAEAVLAFNKAIIDAVADVVPAVKPQAAYYEALGWPGVRTLYETVRYARENGLYVILDGKRNDIGTTMQAYADAYLGTTQVEGTAFEPFPADALTVNAYLGTDGIAPLLTHCRARDKAVFALVKTSNPSSGELQDLYLEASDAAGARQTVYDHMGDACEAWGADDIGTYGYSPVGAVVGATYPAQLAELRARLPHTFFLIPGYGAQGGGAKDVAGGFDARGLGAIVNSSRGILCAWQKTGAAEADFAKAARAEAIRMREDLLSAVPVPALAE